MSAAAAERARPAGESGRDTVVRGILLMLVAGACSSMLHIGVRYLAPHLPAVEIVALRALATLCVTLPIVLATSGAAWRSNRLDLQVVRGLVGVISMWTWYYALGRLPLADAGALSFTTGLFVTLGAALYFREEVGVRRLSALAVGFVGALIILRPGAGVISMPAVAAVFSSALWALSLLMAKYLARYDQSLTISFYQPLTIAPIAVLLALPGWVWPGPREFAIVAGIGAVTSLGNYCYVHALRIAEASLIMPADYVRLIWMAGWGFLFFAEVPLMTTWLGAALIIGATFFITWREAQLAHERRKAAAAAERPT